MARISVCFDLYFLVVKDIKHLLPSLPSILFFHLENVHMFFSYLFISSFISWTLSFSVIKFCVLHILILITCWMQSWQIFCAHYVIGYINHSFHFLHFLNNNFLNCHNIKPILLLLYDDTLWFLFTIWVFFFTFMLSVSWFHYIFIYTVKEFCILLNNLSDTCHLSFIFARRIYFGFYLEVALFFMGERH